MFDLSFGHLAVCFLVALIVLGPERLPVVARSVGRWVGRARTYMRNFSAELERETQITDLKKQLEDTQRILNEQSRQVQTSLNRLSAASSASVAGVTNAGDVAGKPPDPLTHPTPAEPGSPPGNPHGG